MSDYLDRLRDQLVDASRELHGRPRRHWRRRGGAAAAVVVLVGAPPLVATGIWRPQIGDGKHAAPKITAEAPPAGQLATFGVLRRPQTAAGP
jgi:ferric-dicitrate binding protein FerR (iron transport regulator)